MMDPVAVPGQTVRSTHMLSGVVRIRAERRLVLLAALAVLAASLLGAGCGAPAPPGLRLGISYGNTLVRMPDGELAAALDDARTLGADWVRTDLSWQDIQDDGPTTYRWHLFDRVAGAAAARGLTLLPVLAYTPPWARPAGCTHDQTCPPADSGAFARFAAAAAERYAPRGVHTWEVWNEPNLAGAWRPAADPAGYSTLLKATSGALRRADPSARVILGGLAATPTRGGDMDQAEFLAAVSARGGNKAVDGVGYHPYTYPLLASARTAHGTAWDAMDAASGGLRSVLRRYGTPDLPFWITEYGAPTDGPGTASDGRPQATSPRTTHVTEARQAAIAADAVRTAAADADVAALIWYSDRDLGTDRATNENFYGLRRADGSAKPAFDALRGAIAGLRG